MAGFLSSFLIISIVKNYSKNSLNLRKRYFNFIKHFFEVA